MTLNPNRLQEFIDFAHSALRELEPSVRWMDGRVQILAVGGEFDEYFSLLMDRHFPDFRIRSKTAREGGHGTLLRRWLTSTFEPSAQPKLDNSRLVEQTKVLLQTLDRSSFNMTAIVGLEACDGEVEEFEIGEGAHLKRLSAQEFDFYFEGKAPLAWPRNSYRLNNQYALFLSRQVDFSVDCVEFEEEQFERRDFYLAAIRCVCGGSVKARETAYLTDLEFKAHEFGHSWSGESGARPTKLSLELLNVSKRFAAMLPAALNGKGGKKLQLAVDRLDFARSRRRYLDQILDAGIAMEAILVPDGMKGEIGYRFCMNFATLGSSLEDRLAKRKMASTLYNYRSKVAHGDVEDGKLVLERHKKKKTPTKTVEAQDAALKMLAAASAVILHAVFEPSFEFWDHAYWSEAVLGHRPTHKPSLTGREAIKHLLMRTKTEDAGLEDRLVRELRASSVESGDDEQGCRGSKVGRQWRYEFENVWEWALRTSRLV